MPDCAPGADRLFGTGRGAAARPAGSFARHHSRHRPDQVGQIHHAVCSAAGGGETNVNVITEDPIEVRNGRYAPDPGYRRSISGFPQALRHILRHDPDVVMIGEMRDLETCKIAVESAPTGHLVFSTLHTNDAPSTIVRLLKWASSRT